MHVNDLLKIAVVSGASDLHLKVGTYPMMRVRGTLIPATEEGGLAEVVAGFSVGVAFLVVVSRRFRPDHGFMGRTGPGART